MFRLTLKEIAAKKTRLFSTALAVILGVAFLAGTLILTATVTKSFDSILADANAGTDAYVRGVSPLDVGFGGQRPRIDATVSDRVREVPGVAAVNVRVNGYAQLVDRDGELVGDADMHPVIGSNWATVAALNPYRLVDGHAPGEDEVVIDRASADAAGHEVGDRAQVLTTSAPRTFTVAGIATFGTADSMGGATSVLFSDRTAQELLATPGTIDAVAVTADAGVSQRVLAARLRGVVPDGAEVITGSKLVAEDQESVHEAISNFSVFMMIFAGIAMFVGAFIINNTFSIIVAQRSREMAMLRAIGAERKQVRRAVLGEALAVGVVASAIGLALGVVVAMGLKAMLAGVGLKIPGGTVVIETGTVIIAMLTGTVVTVVSALLPARRASKIAPIAALREVALDPSATSRRRAIVGAGIVVAGAFALVNGIGGGAPGLVGLGVLGAFVGVMVLGPVLARPVAWVVGAPIARVRGMAGTIARENAMRNPRRTARTAASLMVGVALVAFIMIFAASAKSSMAGSFAEDYRGTHVVDSGVSDATAGLSPTFATALRESPGVEAVAVERVTEAVVAGEATSRLTGYDPSIGELFDLGHVEGDVTALGADGIAVSADSATSHGWTLGDTVPVTFPTGESNFVVRAVYDGSIDWVGSEFVGVEAFAAHMPTPLDERVFVTADDADAIEAVAAGYPSAEVLDRDDFVASRAEQLDMVLSLMYGMLALAVVIALLGILNTLMLAIHERTRELGLLRAVGMTREQVRASVRWEAAIIALFGTALGLVLGLVFAWAMVSVLGDEGIHTLSVPFDGLVVLAVGGALAGAAASILPARRASRLRVLNALAMA